MHAGTVLISAHEINLLAAAFPASPGRGIPDAFFLFSFPHAPPFSWKETDPGSWYCAATPVCLNGVWPERMAGKFPAAATEGNALLSCYGDPFTFLCISQRCLKPDADMLLEREYRGWCCN